jgi:hypothetical protein
MTSEEKSIPVLRWVDWADAVSILSLDLTLPFYPAMGLTFSQPLKMQAACREVFSSFIDLFHILFTPDHPRIRETFLTKMSSLRHQEFSQQFEIWFDDIFRPPSTEWIAYRFAITTWSAELRHNRIDILGFNDKSDYLVSLHNELVRVNRTSELIARTRATRLSKWDQDVFSIRNYQYDPPEVDAENLAPGEIPEQGVFLKIECAAEQNSFQIFWEILKKHLRRASPHNKIYFVLAHRLSLTCDPAGSR